MVNAGLLIPLKTKNGFSTGKGLVSISENNIVFNYQSVLMSLTNTKSTPVLCPLHGFSLIATRCHRILV